MSQTDHPLDADMAARGPLHILLRDWMADKAKEIYDSATWALIDSHLELRDEERRIRSCAADVLLLTPNQFDRLAVDGYVFTRPVVLRERQHSGSGIPPSPEHLSAQGENARQLFEEHLQGSNCQPMLSVQDPKQPYGENAVQMWERSVVLQELESNLPFNCLSLPDFSGQGRPDFFKNKRFRMLDDLVEKAGLGGTRHDVDFSRQFGLFAKAHAFSGFHCDKLNGTYIQNLAGYKAWAFIIPQAVEMEQFKTAGIDWCPPDGQAKNLVLEPGDILLMPPGVLVVHAPYALTDCAMRGGFFWDSYAIIAILENILETTIKNNQSTTNEAVPEHLDFVLGVLLEYVHDKSCDFFRAHLANLREKELGYFTTLAADIKSKF